MKTEKSRKAFEKWFAQGSRSISIFAQFDDGEYRNSTVRDGWEAWQAALAWKSVCSEEQHVSMPPMLPLKLSPELMKIVEDLDSQKGCNKTMESKLVEDENNLVEGYMLSEDGYFDFKTVDVTGWVMVEQETPVRGFMKDRRFTVIYPLKNVDNHVVVNPDYADATHHVEVYLEKRDSRTSCVIIVKS